MISKNKKQIKRKVKRKVKNPVNIPSNRKIAIDYIMDTAKLIYKNADRSVKNLSMNELDGIVKRMYEIQNDLNLIGLGKPSYLEKEPERYLDPERWI